MRRYIVGPQAFDSNERKVMPLCTALLRTWAPLLGLSLLAGPALAQGTYKIGEINSYKAQPAFLEPYKKGMELAVEQVNASGGIAGRKLQLVVRDDNANPGDAVRAAASGTSMATCM